MKKHFRNLWAIALTVAMVLSLSTVAMAADDHAHFTFYDSNEEQPDLYVTKTVSSALEGYTIPDATFTFVLKWDKDGDGFLEFAENEIYYVYNEDGTQVYNEATSSYIFRTSSTGQFTLKAGQYAKFEWAGQVEYEITELETEGFTQTVPAGGQAATGTVDENGTYVTFGNLYIPEGGGGGEEDTTQLAIRKDISWPGGYEVPDLSEAAFTFQVTIDGAAYANKVYTIYDASMTTVLGTGRTDSEGKFTITGGQLALFEEVEIGVDYQVEEVGTDTGWRAVGQTSYAGATTSPIIYAYFTNAGAEFIVTKDRTDGVVGTEFSFILANADNTPMAGITYYIYDADGNLTGSGTTGADGSFTLCAGEKAIFTGIPDGTEYKIIENNEDNFKVTADSGDSNAVTDTEDYDSVDTHTFVNEELTDITITKYGSRLNTDSNLLAGAEFTVYVLEDGEYVQVGEPLTTGEDGKLTFKNLPAGTYRIIETKTPAGYIAASDPIEVTLPYTSEKEVEGAVYSERDGIYYIYSLAYTVDNTATLVMPNAGGNAWMLIVLAAAGGAAALTGVFVYRKRSSRKERVRT